MIPCMFLLPFVSFLFEITWVNSCYYNICDSDEFRAAGMKSLSFQFVASAYFLLTHQ